MIPKCILIISLFISELILVIFVFYRERAGYFIVKVLKGCYIDVDTPLDYNINKKSFGTSLDKVLRQFRTCSGLYLKNSEKQGKLNAHS